MVQATAAEEPAPAAWSISGQLRLRAEFLDPQFRVTTSGSDRLLNSRVLLRAAYTTRHQGLVAEFQDARQWWADNGTVLTNGIVNTLEPLQAYWEFSARPPAGAGTDLRVKLGRFTQDLGSRRLMSRNRYRNTINAFDGGRLAWQRPGGGELIAFYTLPVQRLPFERAALLDNEQKLDEHSRDVRFWGLHFETPLSERLDGSIYLLGLDERDGSVRDLPTSDRDLLTAGLRLVRPADPAQWEYEVEAAVQWGRSHATLLPVDTQKLDHLAWFFHGQLGYHLSQRAAPSLHLLLDYASGDDNPQDGNNGRFDPLYGTTASDLGPTGLWSSVLRANVFSPGVGVGLQPRDAVEIFFEYRGVWLASSRDAWVGTGIRDVTGDSGSFVGQHLRFRTRFYARQERLKLELGAAMLVRGRFPRDAPTSPDLGNPVYGYTEIELRF